MVRTFALFMAASLAALWAASAALAARPDHPTAAAGAAFDRALAAAPAARSDKGEPKGEPGRTPQFHGLLAASETEVKTRLGAPDVARAEGSGAMWTYRLPDCALFVFFKGIRGEALKVSGAASGPRVRGRSPPPVNECVAEALDRQGALGRANP